MRCYPGPGPPGGLGVREGDAEPAARSPSAPQPCPRTQGGTAGEGEAARAGVKKGESVNAEASRGQSPSSALNQSPPTRPRWRPRWSGPGDGERGARSDASSRCR